jgi:cytochrome c oxidase subunit 3/cytochrome o ubiquinol oxidase subunit 3
MSSTTTATAAQGPAHELRGRVGMLLLILAETSFFAVFLMAYLFYIGKSLNGPMPADVLELPVLATACLLSSSVTIGLAVRALRAGEIARFGAALFVTFALGATFLGFTAMEWHALIFEHGLTIRTNLFGTTYYSLVGFHAAHVSAGVAIMGLVLVLAALGSVSREHAERLEVFSWYWHFVDVVWIAVLTVVYIVGV